MSFDFSIAISPNFTDIDRELRYVKSSLLYADAISLISPVAYVYTQLMTDDIKRDEKNLIRIMKMCVDICKSKSPELCNECSNIIEQYSTIIDDQKYKSNISLKTKIGLRSKLFESAKGLDDAIVSFIGESQSKEFDSLIKSGKLKVQRFEYSISDSNLVVFEYFKKLRTAVKNSYPLFDELSNDLLLTASKCHLIRLDESEKRKIAHAGLSDNLIRKLPSFEFATVNEILDIRKELNAPLANYRKCMLNYSNGIQHMPWEEDFEMECTELYYKEVVPAVEEIDQLTKENSFLKNLGYNLVSDENFVKSSGGLLVGLAAGGVIGNFCDTISENAALVTAGGLWAASKIFQSSKQYSDNQKEIEKKELYFYYKAGNMLKN